MKLITWNMAHRTEAWHRLLDTDADVALLQEAAAPPPDVAARIGVDAEPWSTEGGGATRPWRAAVVRLTDKVQLEWLKPRDLAESGSAGLAVSCRGTLAAAKVVKPDGMCRIVVSMYGLWERPHISTASGWIYADASVHRLISDLSALIGQQSGHRILAAGDLNILYGYGDQGSAYWATRYATVFNRMSALGLTFVGPQAPAGRRAQPWPDELPSTSNNVPTYYTSHQNPARATRQLDFVFVSIPLAEHTHVRALNEPEYWGPSDHCCIEIVTA